MHRRLLPPLLFLLMITSACARDDATDDTAAANDMSESDVDVSSDDIPPADPPDAGSAEPSGPDLTEATFNIRGTLRQLYIWNAPVESAMEVVGPDGTLLAAGQTDDYGSLVIRDLAPASDLTVRVKDAPENRATEVRIMSEADLAPDPELYASQPLQAGNNYITMRDGTQLHVFVSLPGPVEDGPYPTVVNYSGYSPGQPGQTLSDVV